MDMDTDIYLKSIEPANTIHGIALTLKSNYYKMGVANFLDVTRGGANFKATCVMEIYETIQSYTD